MTYRIHSEDVWEQARDAYLSGLTAAEVCERLNLGRTAFYDRARKDGWLRSDQPPGSSWTAEPVEDLLDADPEDLAAIALKRMGSAVRRGASAEALRWRRLHAQIKADLRLSAQNEAADQAAADEVEQRLSGADRVEAHKARVIDALGPGASELAVLTAMLGYTMDGEPFSLPDEDGEPDSPDSVFPSGP